MFLVAGVHNLNVYLIMIVYLFKKDELGAV